MKYEEMADARIRTGMVVRLSHSLGCGGKDEPVVLADGLIAC